jgi:hypothetical protein
MINIDVTLGSTGTTSGAAASSTQTTQLSSLSAQSFTTLLSEALSETLSKFGIDPNSIKLTVQNAPSQTPAASQTPATSQTPAAPAVVTPAASTAATDSKTWYASTPADDAYWSQQPAAVQQLRGIDDLGERKQLGEQLASEGYSIDVPIMVWGWDAGKVTAARESYGYTWVPSAMQQPVSAAPGITGAGIIQYNPADPPSGSIQV